MLTKTRSRLSIENKREICEFARRHPNVKHSDMANYFNEKFNLTIDRSTVSKILLTKEKWLTNKQTSNMFRLRSVKYPKLDKAIELWVSQAIAAGLPLSDQILQEKGCDFARSFNIDDYLYYMRCSNGWVYKFKKRYGLHKITLHGEGGIL